VKYALNEYWSPIVKRVLELLLTFLLGCTCDLDYPVTLPKLNQECIALQKYSIPGLSILEEMVSSLTNYLHQQGEANRDHNASVPIITGY
jgi:hypothetical protein